MSQLAPDDPDAEQVLDPLERDARQGAERAAETAARPGGTSPQSDPRVGPTDQTEPPGVSTTPPEPIPSGPATQAPEDPATTRAAIADTLDRYRDAYEKLDGVALAQVYPAAPQETIAALQNFQAYAVTMNSLSPEVDGNTATVTSQLSLTMTARTGITRQVSGQAVFQLERISSGEWLILGIDASQVR